ncbi:Metallo-beta-lactamase superfamily protein [Amphibacillus marinus]|uniref:Metallo-beta-lactamase superfamily protein n=1 Tax=Amphibacillus marinus TaxID=872970 RepID=A0A1H8L9G6_9BACI|nr:MBL fold metallo-hydrolase [Amphibacillus marinus]SEO01709.1 Metallo-beta-lactamase superfamily protein [Amphibacillus marinus]
MITTINVVKVAHARQRPFFTMSGGSWRRQKYPIYCLALQHTEFGQLLIDVGYGQQFLQRLARFPRYIYQHLIMDKEHGQLAQSSIYQATFDHVFLSHFHPDHLGGLSEVKYQQLKYSHDVEQLMQQSRLAQLRKGFFKELLPSIAPHSYFEDANSLSMAAYGFDNQLGYDLLGDQSIIAIPMAGHAIGQHIFYLQTSKGPVVFGVDVAWHIETIQQQRMPHPVTRLIVHNYQGMMANINQLSRWHQQHQNIPILLSHCPHSLAQLMEWDQVKGGHRIVNQEG